MNEPLSRDQFSVKQNKRRLGTPKRRFAYIALAKIYISMEEQA